MTILTFLTMGEIIGYCENHGGTNKNKRNPEVNVLGWAHAGQDIGTLREGEFEVLVAHPSGNAS